MKGDAMWNEGRAGAAICCFEALEARLVFSSPWQVAGAGVYVEDGLIQSYFGEGQVTSDGLASGISYHMGPSGPSPGTPISIDEYIELPNGGIRVGYDELFRGYDEQFGTQFIAENGYSAGWWAGEDHGRQRAELALLVERPSRATASDIASVWAFETLGFGPTRSYLHAGTASISASGASVSLAGSPGIPSINEFHSLSRTQPGGRFDFRRGADESTLFVSRDLSAIIWSDADYGDSDGAIGIGIRSADDLDSERIAGLYRVMFIELTADGTGYTDVRWALRVEADGSFTAFDLDAFDRGSFDVDRSGSWEIAGSSIELVDGSNSTYSLVVGENGSSLLPTERRFGGTYEKLFGLGARVRQEGALAGGSDIGVGTLDSNGKPLAYDLRDGGEWHVADLGVRANGPAPSGSIRHFESWLDTRSGRLFGAASASEGLFIYQRDDHGRWTVRNMSDDLPGALRISGEFTVFADRGGRVHVAGIDAQGDLVIFRHDGVDSGGADLWTYVNLVDSQLAPKGQAMPPISGSLISYVTRWDGLNIIGLSPDGDIWGLWSGDGGEQWQASNLSDITGAPPIGGGLTAYLTEWDGINIAGLDSAGNLLVTWWVPSFKGSWVTSNLTSIAGGPRFYGSSVASYVAPWGGLNVAGLDASGELVIYWWTPGLDENGSGWQVADMTSQLPPDQPRPTSNLTTRVVDIERGQLNVFGVDGRTGDMIRLYFSPDHPDWRIQNLADVSQFG